MTLGERSAISFWGACMLSDRVGLAGDDRTQCGVELIDDAHLDAVEIWQPLLPVIVVAYELEARVVLPVDEPEWSGADRLAIDVGSLAPASTSATPCSRRGWSARRQTGVRLTEMQGDLVRAGDLDLVHRAEVGLHVGARVGLVALQVEFDGLGIERGAVVEFHARDEIEHERLGIGEASTPWRDRA